MSVSPENRIRDSFNAQSLMRTFDARLERVAPGAVDISAPIGDNVRQQHGFAHAGLSFSLGDSAAGYSALSLLDEGHEVLTTEMKIHLLAPAAGDRLVARGGVIRAGRRLVVVEAKVFSVTSGAEKQVALMTGTMIPVPLG
ncbi:PaaI family thioesterase [Roseovarius aestuariivivens]|uniref:PaaI family thioesterase n=1 Tax=Roseovarius aestuariivivens TaxID=1888910 RepID=UPI001080B165|nr:PaaI family thioesterase [Roseovarius aestuariivivens]